MSVVISNLRKTYPARTGPIVALHDVELSAEPGELLVVVGPSGSGKTTLLRCIAGLETPDAGGIEIGGRDAAGLAPGERDIAMVFQDLALFPHLSARANVAFGLRARGDDVDGAIERVARMLDLTTTLDRMPHELSGGERQRIALARAIVRKPSAFLLDEPLSNLDAETRARARVEIRTLQREIATTTIYVTHDQVEAMTLGDRIAVLRDGRVEQVAAPVELYDAPATSFVARFIGHPPMNVVRSALVGARGASVGIRAEHLFLVAPGSGRIDGTVVAVEVLGADAVVHVDVGDDRPVLVRASRAAVPGIGDSVGLDLQERAVVAFDQHGRAL